MLRVTAEGTARVTAARCRDRLCPLCASRRSREAAERTKHAVQAMDSPRHIVLTAPAVPRTLAEQLTGLRAAMRSLRRSREWRDHVRGGVYTWEITLNRRTGLWHPHIHMLVDGNYWPQRAIADRWREALRTSQCWAHMGPDDPCVVWISAVRSRESTARYISKYVAKPSDLRDWPTWAIHEYASATHGLRLISTFGTLHGQTLDPKDPNEPTPEAETAIALHWIDRLAQSGSQDAQELAACLVLQCPNRAGLLVARPPPDLVQRAARDPDIRDRTRHYFERVRRRPMEWLI